MKSDLKAMRWLLVSLVLLLQVQMPAVARASSTELSCHEMPGDMSRGKDDADHQNGQQAVHVCPGCSIPGQPPLAEARMPAPALRPFAEGTARLISLALTPVPPPPRMS